MWSLTSPFANRVSGLKNFARHPQKLFLEQYRQFSDIPTSLKTSVIDVKGMRTTWGRSPVLIDVDEVCDWQSGCPSIATVDLVLFARIEPLSPDKLRDTLPPNLRGVT